MKHTANYGPNDDDIVDEAEYSKRSKVKLGKPAREAMLRSLKFMAQDPKTKTLKKLTLVIPNMKIKKTQSQDVEVLEQDITAIIPFQEQRQDIGLVESGKMKLKEFTDIDIDKKEDIGYDIMMT